MVITRTHIVGLFVTIVLAGNAFGHCDTMNGPIVPLAQAALEKGDITPLLKWVQPAYEQELKEAFDRAVTVRKQGEDAKELADRYFLETFVRVHRAGEGAPYTGLKDEPVLPIVALADKALETGSVDGMVSKITDHVARGIKEKFDRAKELAKHKHHTVQAGRAYVAAYVEYVHYVEGIRNAVMAAGHAHGGEAAESAEHAEHKQ
jgi:hypothetical protein